MEDMPKQLERYFRKVIAYPEGAVVHHGDCSIFPSEICDCGLLRTLMPIENSEKWYPKCWDEIVSHLDKLGI